MATQLIKHLKGKRDEHSEFELLNAQWDFDQELIKKALQNIPVIFPHYSRHDASHSRQILTNIERLLGPENLKLLTATDTWLLLEAAYWHDIGMVVTHDDIKKDMASVEFMFYIESIASAKGHELQEFAKQFKSLNPKTCFGFADTPQDAMHFYRQLLAGWYRKKHPARAEVIVNDPWKETGIASPRTELVPKRLFRILGTICRLHGASFQGVLDQLPFAESGMATEKCHPRFVACLLRLGDLFDLDDNRFCPSMLRVAGDIPPSSQAHIRKHAAIRHMRLDPETIELTAQCDGYEAYEATDEWFTWIRDEVRDQMSRWKDIVPQREFGLLPTLGKMEVTLAHGDEILNPGERPRFGVDSEKVIELLQGAGLYESPGQCMRELLQNAVDATLLKAWLKIEESGVQIDLNDPYSEDIYRIVDQYPIKVTISKDTGSPVDGKVRWKIRIEDHGLGISKIDLRFMREVGGSSKNLAKKTITRAMPSWLRPSGIFGIGLQSVFLVTDEIELKSKSLLTGEGLTIKMTSPIKNQRGMIYISRYEAHPAQDSGTVLEFLLQDEAIPSRIHLPNLFGGPSITQDVLAKFDPICDEDVPYAAAKLADEINKFREFSPVRVNFDFSEISFPDMRESRTAYEPFYHIETGISILELRFNLSNNHFSRIAFRGQLLEKPKLTRPFVFAIANLLKHSAGDLLTINRNELKESAIESVQGEITKALIARLATQKDMPTDPQERIGASAFLALVDQENVREDLKDEWIRIPLPIVPPLTIDDLCSRDSFSIALTGLDPEGREPRIPDGVIAWHHFSGSDGKLGLLLRRWRTVLKRFCQLDSPRTTSVPWILRFNIQEMDPFSESGLRAALISANSDAWGIASRYRSPAWGPFKRLATNFESIGWCRYLSIFHPDGPQFVVPFFFNPKPIGAPGAGPISTQSFDALCSWTYKNSITGASKSEIRHLYEQFIDWVDNDLMKEESKWQKARSEGRLLG